MKKKLRATPQELQDQIAALTAEADALQQKAETEEGLSPEEQSRLEEIVAQIEQLQNELDQANTEERLARAKARMHAPVSPAPKVYQSRVFAEPKASVGEVLSLFLRSKSSEADLSPEAQYKARSLGISLGAPGAKIPVNYRNLNFKKRAILSKGGSGTGADWVWQSYSDKVTEYLTYASPLVGLVDSETTSDGNARTYFRVDDTSMISTFTSDSGGTETNPTIPDTNMVSDNVVINCFDITSGYQKVSFNELRDAAINLEEKIAKANSNSHARKIEQQIILGTGDGSTGVQGMEDACTALSDVNAWDAEAIEALYFSVPAQYRNECIFVANGDTYGDLYSALKDLTDRSLFGKVISDDIEYDVLMGKKFVQSNYVSADTVLFFNPTMYMLRLVEGQTFQQFIEKFFPNVAWAGIASFGGAWLGPSTAAKKLSLAGS